MAKRTVTKKPPSLNRSEKTISLTSFEFGDLQEIGASLHGLVTLLITHSNEAAMDAGRVLRPIDSHFYDLLETLEHRLKGGVV